MYINSDICLPSKRCCLWKSKVLREIRQGDPLSPYIFILCSQVLYGLCDKAGRTGSFQGIRVVRGNPRINHFLFTDDTMFFTQASQKSCETLTNIFLEYGKASGQMINRKKSSITFSSKTLSAIKENAKSKLGIQKEGGLGKYLGLPEHFHLRKNKAGRQNAYPELGS